MGRKKLTPETKKCTISIVLDDDVYVGLEYLKVKNKSELIDRLLKKHFNLLLK